MKEKEKVYVKYQGEWRLLQPGHKVYQVDTNTGLVTEHKLTKVFRWFWMPQGRYYKLTYKYNIMHLPAFNIDKAVTEFKHMLRPVIDERKREGNPLNIYREFQKK